MVQQFMPSHDSSAKKKDNKIKLYSPVCTTCVIYMYKLIQPLVNILLDLKLMEHR